MKTNFKRITGMSPQEYGQLTVQSFVGGTAVIVDMYGGMVFVGWVSEKWQARKSRKGLKAVKTAQ